MDTDAQPKAIKAPFCPDHKVRMRYNAEEGVMVCPEYDCDVTAQPKSSAGKLRNTVLNGQMEFIRKNFDSEVKWFIRMVDSGVLIDVTDQVDMDATGERHGMNGTWMVALLFPAGVRDMGDDDTEE